MTSTATTAMVLRFPRSTDNGLWAALVARLVDSSAAGSRLAGPSGLGQPISLPVEPSTAA